MTEILKCDMCGADAGDSPYHATIDENCHVHICDGCFYPEHYDLGVLWRERERILAKLNSSERRLHEVATFCATIEQQRDELLHALRGMIEQFGYGVVPHRVLTHDEHAAITTAMRAIKKAEGNLNEPN